MAKIPIVVRCSTIQQYVACALDRDEVALLLGQPVVPTLSGSLCGASDVVDFPGSSSYLALRDLDVPGLVKACMSAANVVAELDTEAFCVVVEGDDVAAIGAVFAVLNRRRVLTVRGFESLTSVLRDAPGKGSVFLFLSPDALVAVGLDAIRDSLLDSDDSPIRVWGLMVGTALEIADWVIRSRLQVTPATPLMCYCWFGGTSPAQIADEPGLEILGPGNIAVEMAAQETRFSMFAGHGRSYCAMDGNLCSSLVTPNDDRSCIDGMECVLRYLFPQWKRLPAAEIRSDIVVLDTCNGGGVSMQAERGRSLATHLVHGRSLAVITPYRSSNLWATTCFLVWEFLRRGYNLGKMTAALNADAQHLSDIIPPYVLFGDPELRPFAVDGCEPVMLTCDRLSEDEWGVVLPPPPSAVFAFRCENNELAEQASKQELSFTIPLREAGEATIQVLPFTTKGVVDFLVTWRHAPKESVPLFISSRIPLNTGLYDLVCDVLACAEELGVASDSETAAGDSAVRKGDAKGPNPITELRGLIDQVRRYLPPRSRPIRSPGIFITLAMAENAIPELLRRSIRVVLEGLCVRRVSLIATFGQTLGAAIVREHRLDAHCYRCGGRVQRYVYRVRNRKLCTRWRDECESCGFLQDVPEDTSLVCLSAREPMRRNRTTQIRIEAFNDTSEPVEMHCMVTVEKNPSMPGAFDVAPDMARIAVPPQGSCAISFEVQPSGAVALHLYRVVAFMMLGARLCSAEALVQVVDG